MTEEQAKTKWCPMRRLTEIGAVRINNTEPGTFTLNCIGSDCAMWRWHGYGTDKITVTMHGDGSQTTNPPPQGHCGLAGKL